MKTILVVIFMACAAPALAGPLNDANGNGLWDFYDEILTTAFPDRARDVGEVMARHMQNFAYMSGSQSMALQEARGVQEGTLCLLAAYGPENGAKLATAITKSVHMYPEISSQVRENEMLIAGQEIPYIEDPSQWLEAYCPESLKSPPEFNQGG